MGCFFSIMQSGGEEHILNVIDTMEIWKNSYTDLKEYLNNLSKDEKIEKKTVEEFLIEPFRKNEEHEPVVNLLLSKLKDSDSFYWVIFYIFPFIAVTESHSKNFYEVLTHLNKNQPLSQQELIKYLKYYYDFVLISLTEQIRNHMSIHLGECDNKENKLKEIDTLLRNVYNIKNIEREMDHVEKLMLICSEEEIAKKFKYATQNYIGLKFNYKDIRDFYMYKFTAE